MLGGIIKGVAELTSEANLDLGIPGSELGLGGGDAEGQALRKRHKGDDGSCGGEKAEGNGELHFEYCLVADGSV